MIRGGTHRGGRRERAGAGRRAGRRRRRRATSIRASSTRARRSAWTSRARAASTTSSEMLDFNPQLRTRVAYHSESDAIPVARANGITTVAVTPGGGILRRRGRGDEPRRLDVGGSDASSRRPAIAFNFPAHRRRRRTRRRRWTRRRAPAETATYEDAEAASATGSSTSSSRLFDRARAYAKAGAGQDRPTGRSRRSCPSSSAGCRSSRRVSREQDIRDAVAFADRAKVNIVISGGTEANARRAAAQGEEHPGDPRQRPDAAVARGRVPRGDATSSRASWRKAGVKIAFSTGDNANVRLLPVPRGDVGRVGPDARRGAQGADDQRGRDPRRRRPRRQHRARQGSRTCSSRRAIRSRSRTRGHARGHRGQGRRPRQQAPRALRASYIARPVGARRPGDRDMNDIDSTCSCRRWRSRRRSRCAARADAPHVYAIRGARHRHRGGRADRHRHDRDAQRPHRRRRRRRRGAGRRDVIDGAGLTVYPGLIDMGNAAGARRAGATGRRRRRCARREDAERWKRERDPAAASSRRPSHVRRRRAGARAARGGGHHDGPGDAAGEVVKGQSALVNVAAPADEPQIGAVADSARGLQVVAHAGRAARATFGQRRRAAAGYPVSLLGVDRVRAPELPRRAASAAARAALRAGARIRRRRARATIRRSTPCSRRSSGAAAGGVRGGPGARDPARARHGQGVQARSDHHRRRARRTRSSPTSRRRTRASSTA